MSEHDELTFDLAPAAPPTLPAPPTLKAGRAILIFFVAFAIQVALGLVLGIAIGVYQRLMQLASDPAQIQQAIEAWVLPIGVVGIILSGAVAWVMIRQFFPGSLRRGSLDGIGWRPVPAKTVLLALVVGAALASVYIAGLLPLFPPAEDHQWGPVVAAAQSDGWLFGLWIVTALLIAPPFEEFIFRGVLASGLKNSFGLVTSLLLTTGLFLAGHLTETGDYWPALVGIGSLAVAAFAFRFKTGSLLPALAVHFGYNLFIVVVQLMIHLPAG